MRIPRGVPIALVLVLVGGAAVYQSVNGLPGTPPPGAEDRPGYPVYRTYCARCHGLGGVSRRATRMAGDSVSLVDPIWRSSVTPADIERIVVKGEDEMEGLGDRLTPEEVRLVVDYVLWMPVENAGAGQ